MCCHSSVVERVLGKDEVVGSTPTGSFFEAAAGLESRPGGENAGKWQASPCGKVRGGPMSFLEKESTTEQGYQGYRQGA